MALLSLVTGVVWLLAVGFAVGAVRGRGLIRRLRRLVAAALCACLGILLGSFLVLRHGFHAFAGETLVAKVTTSRLGGDAFELTYRPATDADAAAQTVQLRGDQWGIGGGVVVWHPWLTMLGVKSYYKPMRLSGQFSSLARQRAELPTVHALVPEADHVWEALYRASRYLPFIEAVYGSSAYVYVEPGAVQEVYVTHSGYMIKRHHPSR
jgi:hypothetical protein